MPHACHPLVLFSLVPVHGNEGAKRVVSNQDNIRHVSTIFRGGEALDIGIHLRSKSPTTLATMGRDFEADIYVEGSDIAKVQCSFEIDLHTGIFMFYDRSHSCTTQVSGENATPFEPGRVRKVVVQKHLNTIIGMGGDRSNLFEFQLIWHNAATGTANIIKEYAKLSCVGMVNPRHARTVDEAPTDPPSRRQSRLHAPEFPHLKMRYMNVEGEQFGSGTFGTVSKVIDVDTGTFTAMKILKQPTKASEQEKWKISSYYAFNYEAKILSEINHPHIVNYIASQGWDEPPAMIFMGLKDGTLKSLINGREFDARAVTKSFLRQMLEALDCIAYKGIIHRDVKPENILYTTLPGGEHHFELGDFGLCARSLDAGTNAGTLAYMPPEVIQQKAQTTKIDVWSLFATVLWTLDAGGFRQKSDNFRSTTEAHRVILSAASSDSSISDIREVAIANPEERASAAQLLVKLFGGAGLSTPRNQVPALTTSPAPRMTTARVPPPAFS